jgi:hypothetical protein
MQVACAPRTIWVAARSELKQNDHAVKLAVGDVALVDTARRSTFSPLHLPRQPLVFPFWIQAAGGLVQARRNACNAPALPARLEPIEDEASACLPSPGVEEATFDIRMKMVWAASQLAIRHRGAWRAAPSTPTTRPCRCWLPATARPRPAGSGFTYATSGPMQARLRRPCSIATLQTAKASTADHEIDNGLGFPLGDEASFETDPVR